VSPIFVRPVREQLEHDRLIRHLQLKYKRKFEVALNLGDEQVAPVKIGALTLFPDLVLTAGRKLGGVVEVESGESVNNLEAMAQWVHFARSRVPFHLYVPVPSYESARRLCEANKVHVSEVWTYRPVADGFDLVRMSSDPKAVSIRHKAFAPRPAGPADSRPPRPPLIVSAARPKAAIAKPVRPAASPRPSTPAKASAPAKPAIPAKPAAASKPAKLAKPAKVVKPVKLAAKAKPKAAAPVKKAVARKAKPAPARRK
jgi:hypothetical protein